MDQLGVRPQPHEEAGRLVVKHLVKLHGTRYKKKVRQQKILKSLLDRGRKRIKTFLEAGVNSTGDVLLFGDQRLPVEADGGLNHDYV